MPEITCESRITHVAVYARGAVVTRQIALPESLPEESFDLLLPGISPLAEAGSFRVELMGEREVLGLRSQLFFPSAPVEPGAARERVRQLTLAREALLEEQQEKQKRRAFLASLLPKAPRPSRFRAPSPGALVRDSLAVSNLLVELLASLDESLLALEESLKENARALEAAQLAASQARSAELAGEGHPTRQVAVRLSAGGEVHSLLLSYIIAGARWWPAYSARLTEGATRATLAIEAFVAQVSGEDWKDALISLVTADLVHDARLPELPSLRLGRAQPPKARGFRPPPPGLDALFSSYDQARAGLPQPPPEAAPAALEPEEEDTSILLLDQLSQAQQASLRFAQKEQEQAKTAILPPAPTQALLPPGDRGRGAEARPQPPPAVRTRAAKKPIDESAFAYMPPMELPPAAAKRSRGLLSGLGNMLSFGDGISAPASYAPQAPGGGSAQSVEVPLPIEPADAWLDFDSLRLSGADDPARRGRLFRSTEPAAEKLAQKAIRLEEIPAPWRTRDPLTSRGLFDARYDTLGTCDIPSDARPHRILLQSAEAVATPTFRTVPRESAEVYRQAELKNPFPLPLLAGPVEIFLDGALLCTAELGPVDRGGTILLGLGVEERLRVARNARMEETSAGLLGGTTVLDHSVSIELASALGHPVTVQVLDRYPVSDDKSVEISLVSSTPEHTPYDQAELGAPVRGGLSWKVPLAPGAKAQISFSYRISIPAKNEIVGGNRRE